LRKARRSVSDRMGGDSVRDLVTILLVEDNPDDATLTELALRQGISAKLEIARDGQEALDYLSNEATDVPRLVLLDLRLPSVNGLEVLRRIREHDRTRLIPVVIVTNSAAPSDVAAAYQYGTNSYIRKPVDFNQFAELIRLIGSYWLVANEPPPDARDR
jgi:two-component system, response regulator